MGVTPRPGPSPELPKPPRDPAERLAWLKGRLDEVFAVPGLAKAKISAVAIDVETGKTIYAHGEKASLNAASNVKIVTAAAALALLGPEYRGARRCRLSDRPAGRRFPPGARWRAISTCGAPAIRR